MADKKNEVAKTDVGQQVINRIDQLCQIGFNMPNDYNYVNAIKGAMLMLPEIKDKSGKSALEICKNNNSIQSALFKMATKGLDVSKKQGYLILRGDKLCFEESYFGVCLQARRISKYYEPIANIIYKGDTFKFEVDPATGRKRIVEHTQTLESIDGEMLGAYAMVTNDKGETDVEIMSIAQIRKSWSKSSSQQQLVHKEFPDQMAKRTVIKRAAKMLINSSLGDNASINDDLEDASALLDASKQIDQPFVEYEEIVEEETPSSPINEHADVQQSESATSQTSDDENF